MLLHRLEHLPLHDGASNGHEHDTGEVGVENGVDVANLTTLDFVDQHILVGEATGHNTDTSHCHIGSNEGGGQNHSLVKEEESEESEDHSEADINAPEEHCRLSQVEHSFIKSYSEDKATPSGE